jgi:hypothetical protein
MASSFGVVLGGIFGSTRQRRGRHRGRPLHYQQLHLTFSILFRDPAKGKICFLDAKSNRIFRFLDAKNKRYPQPLCWKDIFLPTLSGRKFPEVRHKNTNIPPRWGFPDSWAAIFYQYPVPLGPWNPNNNLRLKTDCCISRQPIWKRPQGKENQKGRAQFYFLMHAMA